MVFNKSLSSITSNKLFEGISSRYLELAVKQNNFLEISEGEIVYQSGDKSEFLYLICEGEIKLKIYNPTGGSSIYRKGKGDFFGEKEFLARASRRSSAVANTDCVLYKLDRKEIIDLSSKSKLIQKNLTGAKYEIDPSEVIAGEAQPEENQISDEELASENFFKSEDEAGVELKNDLVQQDESSVLNELTDKLSNEIPEENNETTAGFETKVENANLEKYGQENLIEGQSSLTIVEDLKESKPMPVESEIYKEAAEQALHDLKYIYKSRNVFEAVTSILESAKNFTRARFGSYYFINAEKKVLLLQVPKGNELSVKEFQFNAGLAGSSAFDNQIINLKNPAEDPRFEFGIDAFDEIELGSIICFPFCDKFGNPVSLIQLGNSADGSFTKRDEIYLEYLSGHAVNIIQSIGQWESVISEKEKLTVQNNLNGLQPAADFLMDDLKAPLTMIKHYADFIKKKEAASEIKQAANFIIAQADAAGNFASTVSDYMNAEKSLNTEVKKLSALINEILIMLADYVEPRKVKIFKKFDADGLVEIDKSKLFQAFYRLAIISCGSMADGGNIYIVVSKKQNKIFEISYKDSGKISFADLKEKLSVQGPENHFGFGFAIAKKLLSDQGCTVKLEEGTSGEKEFVISIPLFNKEKS